MPFSIIPKEWGCTAFFSLSNVKLIGVLSNLDFAPQQIHVFVQSLNDDVSRGGCKWSAILKADINTYRYYVTGMLIGFLSSTWNVAALLSRFLKLAGKNDQACCRVSQQPTMKLKPVDGPTREILYAFAFLWGRSYYHSYQLYRLHLVDVPLHASVFLLYSPFVEASESCKNETHNPRSFFSMRASTMSIHFSLPSFAGCGKYSHPCVTCSAESDVAIASPLGQGFIV